MPYGWPSPASRAISTNWEKNPRIHKQDSLRAFRRDCGFAKMEETSVKNTICAGFEAILAVYPLFLTKLLILSILLPHRSEDVQHLDGLIQRDHFVPDVSRNLVEISRPQRLLLRADEEGRPA